jgi:methylmalonyl-CoA mutase cobalamin-binding subunit
MRGELKMQIQMEKRFEYKNLPDMETFRNEIDKIASEITIGETLFMKKFGVRSEGEYKRKCMETGHIMKHSHIGYNTWNTTVECVRKLYEELQSKGSYIDRFGFCLDNVMGIPDEWREGQLVGTGLIFRTSEEWSQIGQIVPVQPHCGDMMIGTLNGLENTVNALRAGATTIGNPSHYYTYEWPGLDKEEHRVCDMVKALGVMGKFRDVGVIVHSNLDDGYGGQLQDLANLTGWAMIERYYVEELLGAGLGHCFGNLFSDPIMRIIFSLAMADVNVITYTPGSMVYGNTTDYCCELDRNFGALVSFGMGDVIGQMYKPTGHAVVPIPITEAARIPTVEEIIQANMVMDMIVKKAPCYSSFLNWEKIIAEKELLVKTGQIFFERVINGLDELDVDIEHAGEVLGALKAIGPAQLETAFGVGKREKEALRGRVPVRPTDAVKNLKAQEGMILGKMGNIEGSLTGIKIIMGTTDVHEFGKQLVKSIVLKADATVFDLGTSIGTAEIIDAVIETESKIIIISTYNGIAYSYAKKLLNGLKSRGLDHVKIIMGGLLNENPDNSELAEDVSGKLSELGVNAVNKAEKIVDIIYACLENWSLEK